MKYFFEDNHTSSQQPSSSSTTTGTTTIGRQTPDTHEQQFTKFSLKTKQAQKILNRKQDRKNKRQEKKVKRGQYFNAPKLAAENQVRLPIIIDKYGQMMM